MSAKKTRIITGLTKNFHAKSQHSESSHKRLEEVLFPAPETSPHISGSPQTTKAKEKTLKTIVKGVHTQSEQKLLAGKNASANSGLEYLEETEAAR